MACSALAAAPLRAQTNNYAATFLLQPVGARAVGQGEAAVADTTLGTESLWWNPAGMARLRKKEFAVHHAQTFAATNDMLAFALPSAALGTIAVSYLIVNYGDIPATGPNGEPLGTSTNRYHVLSAAYATPVGKNFSAGLTARLVMLRFVCGGCGVDIPNILGNTSALDVGAQYVVPVRFPVTLGASIRNLGPKLQVRDAEQADPLPRVVQVGARARVPVAALQRGNAALNLQGDVFLSPAYGSPSLRLGADLSYQDTYVLRAGFKGLAESDGNEGGLTVGFGLKYNSVQLDLARRFDASANLGEAQAPTYVSLRFVF